MNNQYDFSVPVCNLTIDLWDLDRDDEMLLQAFDAAGNPVTYTINTIGAGVNNAGNTFYSNDPSVNYPSDGPATLGMFSVTFNGCVSQIEIDYFDTSDTAGDGGSYTIVFFQENCVIEPCMSEELSVMASPVDCTIPPPPVCPEDIAAILMPAGPVCLGDQIDFDASGSAGQNVSYEWDFDSDGVVDLTTTVPTTSFTYPTAGIFTVTLTIVDPAGVCDPDTTTIDVEICAPLVVTCPASTVDVLEGDPIDPAILGQPTVTTTTCNPIVDIIVLDAIGPGDCVLEELSLIHI